MGSKGWFPCCSNCIIHRDLFDRADGDSLGAGWTEYAGDADIKDEKADLRQDDTICYSNYDDGTQPDEYGHVVYAKVYGNEDGVQARLIAGAVLGEASDNYYYGQLEFGSSNATLKLYKHDAGTDTEHGYAKTIGIPLGTEVDMCLSMVPESPLSDYGYVETTVRYFGNEYGVRSDRVQLTTHEKKGFGCGTAAVTAGNLTVDDWQGRRSSMDSEVSGCPDCPPANCLYCGDNEAPNFLEVEISGADTAHSCCEDINGTYVLSYIPFGTNPNPCVCAFDQGCVWNSAFFGFPCGTGSTSCVAVEVFHDPITNDTTLYVNFPLSGTPEGAGYGVRLKKVFTNQDVDCLAWDEEQVDTIDGLCVGSGDPGPCDHTNLVAKITSL
tara:strand:- start:426 stop:1571 length:1146 start_codon:yes stop_codon:yes gene_type:complete